eukprot:Pgem_evm1s6710
MCKSRASPVVYNNKVSKNIVNNNNNNNNNNSNNKEDMLLDIYQSMNKAETIEQLNHHVNLFKNLANRMLDQQQQQQEKLNLPYLLERCLIESNMFIDEDDLKVGYAEIEVFLISFLADEVVREIVFKKRPKLNSQIVK